MAACQGDACASKQGKFDGNTVLVTTRYGSKIRYLKQQLKSCNEHLYREEERNGSRNTALICSLRENKSNLMKKLEQYERRDYYADKLNHQMPPPPPPKN